MKTINALSKSASIRTLGDMATAMARNILFSRLSNIKIGHLTVEENGEVFCFGEDRNESSLLAEIIINDLSCYTKILLGGTTGSGEAYMLNTWQSPDLVSVIRLFVANKPYLENMESCWSWLAKFSSNVQDFFRINSKAGSKKNISAHYDLSNDFFELFLDKTMMYSSAIFPTANASLEDAAVFKLDHICKRLNLQPEDHLLEIGTGWGGMAVHAAKRYGCKVTTTTISCEQYDLAKQRVIDEGLEGRITVLREDYRDLTGKYDKLVSIEMVEAVGFQFYNDFFARCSNLLNPSGLFLMQAITTQDQRYEREKRRSDFIRKYIFPGGCLPSNEVIMKTVSKVTDMHLVGLEDITLDYAKTLSEWRKRFFAKLEEIKKLGFDDTFVRMWDFYLCYCEGGFAEREINTSQFVFAKPKCLELPVVR